MKRFAAWMIALIMIACSISALAEPVYTDWTVDMEEHQAISEELRAQVAEAVKDLVGSTIEPVLLLGSQRVSEKMAESNLDDETAKLLRQALQDKINTDGLAVVQPLQVFDSRDYCVLARVTPVVPDAEAHWALVYIHVDVDGTATLVDIVDLALER